MSSEISRKDGKEGALSQRLPRWFTHDWIWGLILVLAIVLVYQPAWNVGFIWDDDFHVTSNPYVVGPLGWKEIWTTGAWRSFPLVISTFRVEHALWGLAPLPYHLVNVFQHAACAVLFWRILRHLQVPGAWLGAALWALHPVEVESVVWISEMKNTESCLFYLLTILFFVRWLRTGETQKRGDWNYALSLFCAALAIASKSSTAVLPVVLALCAWWMAGKWNWRHLLPLAPMFLMSVVAVAITMWPQGPDMAPSVALQWARSWPERIATVGDVIWFYLGKLLWPHPLMTIYPRWQIDAGQWTSWLPLLAVILAWYFLWRKRGSRFRPVFFAMSYFLVAMSPFLGLIYQSFWRYSFVEDHLQYLACMGPLALAGAATAWFADLVMPGSFRLQSSLCAALLLVLGLASWQRSKVYENSETLWTDAVVKNPDCWVGHYNLGVIFAKKGEMNEAQAEYQKSLEINSNYAEAHYNLGVVLAQKGEMNEAQAEFRKTLEINSDFAVAHNNLGGAYMQAGKVDEAITEYQKSLAINADSADSAEAHFNLGYAYFLKGRVDEAIAEYHEGLAINPGVAEVHYRLGNALLQKKQLGEAVAEYQYALKIDPSSAKACNNLGIALAQMGRTEEAIAQFQEAVRLKPDYADAEKNLDRAKAVAASRTKPAKAK